MINSAFSSESKPYIQFVRPTLASFLEIFEEHNFVHYAINTAIISIIGTVITVSLAVIGGYALYKLNIPDIVILALWISTFVPLIAFIIPYYIFLSKLGLVNTYIGAAIVLSVANLPYYIWLMKNFFVTFPKDLEEAATIDGCGRIRILFSIILPLSLPPIGLITAMSFNGAWGDFLAPLVLLTEFRVMPLSVGMFVESVRPWTPMSLGSIIFCQPSRLFT
jgi:multiple sugar transport system permease protein